MSAQPSQPRSRWYLVRSVPVLVVLGACSALALCPPFDDRSLPFALRAAQAQGRDPAAWGADHVAQGIPEYTTGDECLFCHREKVGPTWQRNRHFLNFRLSNSEPEALAALQANDQTKSLVEEIQFAMGGNLATRFLKRSAAYGKLELLSTACVSQADNDAQTRPCTLRDAEHAHWDPAKFADRCAGCHATAVDTETRAFAALGFDCYVCHGAVDPGHAENPTLVHLSKARKDPAEVVTSICAQCHVRSGKSKSTELPYPNTFVAGDNLFRDFVVDFSDEQIASLNPADRHIMQNVRDVVLRGESHVTCLSCHDIHGESSQKHQRVSRSRHLCLNCHYPDGPKSKLKEYEVHSQLCEY